MYKEDPYTSYESDANYGIDPGTAPYVLREDKISVENSFSTYYMYDISFKYFEKRFGGFGIIVKEIIDRNKGKQRYIKLRYNKGYVYFHSIGRTRCICISDFIACTNSGKTLRICVKGMDEIHLVMSKITDSYALCKVLG